MQQKLKKLTAFIFLLIMAMPLFMSLSFILQQNMIQEETEERLKSGKLETLSVPESQIRWVRNGKEVLYEDKLFDVKSYTVLNDIITLTGYFDMEETELQEEYKKLVHNKDGDPPFGDLVIKLLLSSLFTNPPAMTHEAGWHFMRQQYYLYDEVITAAAILPITPPPQS